MGGAGRVVAVVHHMFAAAGGGRFRRWIRLPPLCSAATMTMGRSIRHRAPEGAPQSVGPSRSNLGKRPALLPVSEFNDDLAAFQTEPELWKPSMTFARAWPMLFDKITQFELDSDTASVNRLTKLDLWALARASNRSELQALLDCLPESLRSAVVTHSLFDVDTIEEIYLHIGQQVEIRTASVAAAVDVIPTTDDVRYVLSRVGKFADDGRACVPGTLHRVSCWMSRVGSVLGLTMRVGRYLPGVARHYLKRARSGNLLFLSKPGLGKTTILRDMAISLARRPDAPRVIVIDSSNEIGGDSDAPLPCFGRVRRLQVPKRHLQLRYMTQAVQNHSPDYVIIDEIATVEEAEAALTMAQRGVRLIGTAHGETLAKLVQNRALNSLVGGVAQAFLSNEERKLKLKLRKTVLERPYDAPFNTVVELRSRTFSYMHIQVNQSVDMILDDRDPWQDRRCCRVVRHDEENRGAAYFPPPRPLATVVDDDEDGPTNVGPMAGRAAVDHRGAAYIPPPRPLATVVDDEEDGPSNVGPTAGRAAATQDDEDELIDHRGAAYIPTPRPLATVVDDEEDEPTNVGPTTDRAAATQDDEDELIDHRGAAYLPPPRPLATVVDDEEDEPSTTTDRAAATQDDEDELIGTSTTPSP